MEITKEALLEKLSNENILIGELSTSQQIKMGKTKSGKPIYQVKPFKKIYPPFWITYGGKLLGKIIIAFKFKDWPDNSPLPFGEIYHIIGIADDNNISEALKYHYQIIPKKITFDNSININEKNINRIDLTSWELFSIDPKGCLDIDDCLSYHINNNKIIVGVHIAQPIYWLSKETILEKSKYSFSTLYELDKNTNLWGDTITQYSSLSENDKKPAYSIIFEIENNKIVNSYSYPSFVINKKVTNYDEINFPNINNLMALTKDILNKDIDSHELVSHWMIQANQYIGEKYKQNHLPYRCQKISDKKIDNIIDDTVKKLFENMIQESAYYSFEDNFHNSLNLENYVHFTSPIRRIIDTIIHYQITYNDNLNINLDQINKIDKNTKKFHRDINIMKIIDSLPNEKETFGWIYEKNKNKWTIYFEELGFINVKIWDIKFDDLVKKEEIDKYIIGEKYQFKIYKKMGFLPKQKILIVPTFSLL